MIAFIVQLGRGMSDLYLADADGASAHPLFDDGSWYDAPAWAPGGGRLAFATNRAQNWHNLWMLDVATAIETQLTFVDDWNGLPAWSPDGGRIAFTSHRAGNYDLWIMAADGSEPRQLTDTPANDYGANWSPDGRRIAFTSNRSGNDDIWTVDVQTGELRRLTTGAGKDFCPAWSPVGDRIAYLSAREDGFWDIWLIDPHGTRPWLLAETRNCEYGLAWSPDGAALLVAISEPGGHSDLCMPDLPWPVAGRLTGRPRLGYPAWAR